ncbi:hypothetical protein Val02_41260 [Virgisporangium aliadipatigenens]|uniref:Uncharacterized protein n=1 Tax=Virgisporangium aliadipatigenens TaxID=741659 RepID=A0A8J3YNR4_9ACTN|nr:hypothetical protein [Virgisporangium aliadipatigenens]GIJ47240.1 hypothetical protein Val02_41260 [Virgisporangium aliadipatigenens]
MAPLTLTPERRAELAELLGNEQRLEVEFPKVAEYLDTAATLPGTGDDEADRAFDFRMLHYMTGDRSVSKNPYWDIVAPVTSMDGNRRIVTGGRPQGSARLAYAQTLLQATYAYAIPSPETVSWIINFCSGQPIVEMGAGRGYWAVQLAHAGMTVDAYDLEPPDKTENVSFPRADGQSDVWHPVGGVEDFKSRLQNGPEAVLLLCWPPGWENPMASEALAAFEESGGKRIIYIGEPRGGKTANNQFFDAIEAQWSLESEDPQFVSWWNLADKAQAWVHRR